MFLLLKTFHKKIRAYSKAEGDVFHSFRKYSLKFKNIFCYILTFQCGSCELLNGRKSLKGDMICVLIHLLNLHNPSQFKKPAYQKFHNALYSLHVLLLTR
jgi:ABC-type transport system involved in Fe-S cluster assembly fused permease/ATPase subunit